MNFEQYQKEQCTIDMMKANLEGMKYLVFFLLIFALPYYFMHGLESTDFFPDRGVLFKGLFPFAMLLAGIVVHELVHGVFFAKYAKQGMRSVRFGIMWKYLAPYAHCKEPLKIKHYTVALLAPLVVTGLLPGIIGVAIGNMHLTGFGIVMSAAAVGDLMIYKLIRKENPEDYVQDHPSEAGYYIYRKI